MAKGMRSKERIYWIGLTTMKVIAMSLVFMLVIVFVGLTGFIIVSNSTGTMSAIQYRWWVLYKSATESIPMLSNRIGSQAFKNSIKKSTTLIFKNREAEKLHEAAKSVNFPYLMNWILLMEVVWRLVITLQTTAF